MSKPALYVRRRKAMDELCRIDLNDNDDDASEQAFMELAERWHTGDLADTRFPMHLREMAWWLALETQDGGTSLIGVSQTLAIKAGHYAGITISGNRTNGYRRTGVYHHR